MRGRYLNSRFTPNDGTFRPNDRYTIKLQVLAYKKLNTKYIDNTQTVDLGGTAGTTSTYVIPKQNGF